MIKNYLKITIRNIQKHKGFSFINIFGLAAGIACTLLISLYIGYELSYEKWNPNADRIFRVYSDINFGNKHMRMSVTGVPIGPDVAGEIPEVQTFCRLRNYGSMLVKRQGESQQNFKETDILTADSTFFQFFPLTILEGDGINCLKQPNTIAIAASRADKFFGSPQLAIGQTLVLDNDAPYKVTAVYKDLPANTHFKAGMLISMNGNNEVKESSSLWAMSNNFHTYLLLRKGADPETFKTKFATLSRDKISYTSQQLMGMDMEEFEATGQHARFELQPIADIHLHSDLDFELAPNSSIQYVWIFGAIGLFVLLIACINFMNLTTARSAHRAKEIGVRKALGSQRSALIGQFLTETFVMTIVAVLLALIITNTTLPWFIELSSMPLTMPWTNVSFWLSLIALVGLVGLLAGSYPAFFLSAFKAVRVLKGELSAKASGANLRSGLVVFQFVTSIVLIIATVLVYNQLNYIQNKKLGFAKEQVIVLEDAWTLGDKLQTFKEVMLKNPIIKSATISSYLPVPSARSNSTYTTSREFRQDNTINMGNWRVDQDYAKTMGLEMAAGRFFDKEFLTDSAAIILNETAARTLGFDNPIGQKIYAPNEIGADTDFSAVEFNEFTVIGVVKDFHWESLRQNIGSLCMFLGKSSGNISFRYQADKSEDVIASLSNKWQQMAPGQPFAYNFLDEKFANMYEAEQKIGTIALGFALISMFISCLGLFGLASFMAEQRTKEIGIRKVLGANVTGIVGLLSKDFLKLVLISLVIAIPIAWYFMDSWLQHFAYRIDIQWWVFALSGIAALVVAFLTVSFQSIKAALTNPVDSLKTE